MQVRADQAHRGYEVSTDETGYGCINPLYMSYQPSAAGLFQGQHGYGYRSLESLIDAANDIRAGTMLLTLHRKHQQKVIFFFFPRFIVE